MGSKHKNLLPFAEVGSIALLPTLTGGFMKTFQGKRNQEGARKHWHAWHTSLLPCFSYFYLSYFFVIFNFYKMSNFIFFYIDLEAQGLTLSPLPTFPSLIFPNITIYSFTITRLIFQYLKVS